MDDETQKEDGKQHLPESIGDELLSLPPLHERIASGELREVPGAITPCEMMQKGRFYPPNQPQTRVISHALLDPALAEVVLVRLCLENWKTPDWIVNSGPPDKIDLGGYAGWGRWIRAGLEWDNIGGKVVRVYAGYFFNESNTRNRLAAINILFRYK